MSSRAITAWVWPLSSIRRPFDLAAVATDAWRRAEIPAGNAHGNARSVARIQSIVSNGGEVDGVRLLSPRTIELIFDQQSEGVDLAVGLPARFGIGYGLPHPVLVRYIPDGRCCFWFGWGGAIVVNDLDRQMTFAYVMNKMGMSSPGGLGTDRTKPHSCAPTPSGQPRRGPSAVAGSGMEARWLLVVMSGLRWGEVLGLSWQDVNLDRGTARIRQALQYQPGTGRWRRS
jgi:hypothetical protein